MSDLAPNQPPEAPQGPGALQGPGTPQGPGEQKPVFRKYNSFQVLIGILIVMGLFTILSGIISLVGALLGSLTGVLIEDVVFKIVFGTLIFASALVLSKRKVLGLWIFTGGILLSLAYELIMDRGINYIILLFGAVVAWQLLTLQRRGELK